MLDERAASSCYRISEGLLVPIRPQVDQPHPLAVLIHSQFRGMILSPGFPCLGAAGAVRRCDYRFAIYDGLGSAEAVRFCVSDLVRFVSDSPADSNPVA